MNNEKQICPKCGEENPDTAVMCWACCLPLGDDQRAPAPADETSTTAKNQGYPGDVAAYAAMASLAGSGWLPRPLRLPVLGASLSVLGGPILRDKWREHFASDEPDDDTRMGAAKESDLVYNAQTVLLHALQGKATRTRIEEDGKSVRVKYEIEGEWREQMRVPFYIWKPLRQRLLSYARQGEFKPKTLDEEWSRQMTMKLVEFRAQLEVNGEGETLELQFQSALPAEFEGDLSFNELPAVDCLRCKENNVPDAVWCWNCGAELKPRTEATDNTNSIFSALMLAGLAASASSGWWSRRARLPILGVGALVAAAPFALDKLEEKQDRERAEDDERRGIFHSWEAPVARISNQILLRAIKEPGTTIWLRENGNVVVSYQVGENWRQGAVLPAYVWLALRNDLLNRARGSVTCQGKKYFVRAKLNSLTFAVGLW